MVEFLRIDGRLKQARNAVVIEQVFTVGVVVALSFRRPLEERFIILVFSNYLSIRDVI